MEFQFWFVALIKIADGDILVHVHFQLHINQIWSKILDKMYIDIRY